MCLRCAKAQRPCVDAGAAKQQHFTIHLENDYASSKSVRPRGPRSALVPMRPEFDIQTRARAYFLEHHFRPIEGMPDVVASWPECYHQWSAGGKSSDLVDLALSSLALAIFARKYEQRSTTAQAYETYHRSLCEMQTCLVAVGEDLDPDLTDALLLTAYFMARYESILQQDGDQTIPIGSMKVWSHFDGAVAMLKSWFDGPYRNQPTSVIRQARRTLLRSSLLREQNLPSWLSDGGVFGESGLALQYDRLVVRTLDLRHKLSQAERDGEHGTRERERAGDLLQQAHTVYQDIEDWADKLPSEWSSTLR